MWCCCRPKPTPGFAERKWSENSQGYMGPYSVLVYAYYMLKIIKERELLFAPDVTGLVHFFCASAATEVGLALIMP